ncbi:MAG TPA: ribosomal protein S18-alanine N-acetyltransferase [Albitalea sp.]|nr:ribosomal protein S18-alanine N-acetyltransferase [Albitalea sp.]
MSALLRGEPRLVPMTVAELNPVVVIEAAAYDFPWTRGNFIDSLAAGYLARVLRDAGDHVVGYFVAMKGVDEVHLLNLTVAPPEQGQGCARRMLDELVSLSQAMHAHQLWLEVRESNARARTLYLRYGFRHVGIRRGYYPALQGRREDAAVMSLQLAGGRDGLE